MNFWNSTRQFVPTFAFSHFRSHISSLKLLIFEERQLKNLSESSFSNNIWYWSILDWRVLNKIKKTLVSDCIWDIPISAEDDIGHWTILELTQQVAQILVCENWTDYNKMLVFDCLNICSHSLSETYFPDRSSPK